MCLGGLSGCPDVVIGVRLFNAIVALGLGLRTEAIDGVIEVIEDLIACLVRESGLHSTI